jgi:hypothetical protein
LAANVATADWTSASILPSFCLWEKSFKTVEKSFKTVDKLSNNVYNAISKGKSRRYASGLRAFWRFAADIQQAQKAKPNAHAAGPQRPSGPSMSRKCRKAQVDAMNGMVQKRFKEMEESDERPVLGRYCYCYRPVMPMDRIAAGTGGEGWLRHPAPRVSNGRNLSLALSV